MLLMTILEHRRSLRLSGVGTIIHKAGAYFITICARNRQSLLGTIINNQMQLNPYGRLPKPHGNGFLRAYDYVELDEWINMPNHLHGIIFISSDNIVSTDCRGSCANRPYG